MIQEAPTRYTVSELATKTRVPIPTIKYYLREGLLRSGDLNAKQRAFYGDQHVERLRLVVALRQMAGLEITTVRQICRLLDRNDYDSSADVVAQVVDTLGKARSQADKKRPSREALAARAEVRDLLAAKQIHVRSRAQAVNDLGDALLALRRAVGAATPVDVFAPYLDAMCSLAERDFRANAPLLTNPRNIALATTLGAVLWEPILILLRRVAHEHVAAVHLTKPRLKRVRSRT